MLLGDQKEIIWYYIEIPSTISPSPLFRFVPFPLSLPPVPHSDDIGYFRIWMRNFLFEAFFNGRNKSDCNDAELSSRKMWVNISFLTFSVDVEEEEEKIKKESVWLEIDWKLYKVWRAFISKFIIETIIIKLVIEAF